MATLPGFLTVPQFQRYALTHGRAPRCLVPEAVAARCPAPSFPPDGDLVCVDFLIDDGDLIGIGAPGEFDGEIAVLDLSDALVLPAFTELHTHLDKGHIWPRQGNPDGSFAGAPCRS